MLVSSSFSKNFGLYGERVGLLSMANSSPNILSHLRALIRSSYSNPPLHGARLVATILQTPELKSLWMQELAAMRERLGKMRKSLLGKPGRGLFYMTGLTTQQIESLRREKGIYLLENGRLNLAGLNENNVDLVAQALVSV